MILKSNKNIDISSKILTCLNFLFVILIIANILMDLYFGDRIDYGNIIWLGIALILINVIK
ncbi:hypothetical protein CYJ28_07200 [Aerococcus sanguinicola]|uniref:Uncharacterized protein n=1 Tax=Aerococcus sanguinicola TaxID=119206 RepID=A0A0X8FAG0_9LACT|nr:hypothetical protein AWM72_01900 [Aerococcus sanguinicola]OFT97956.1 hypothetical protein HMPREF3090_00300 [Aerococcus sp. HMSC23C02]PKZ21683.1 hypothetical protein CYJ28_07200 [Aerococcus sanguinicola]